MIYRHTVRTNCVPSGTLLFIPLRPVLYQRALAGTSTDDLQTYCMYQVRTKWFFYSYFMWQGCFIYSYVAGLKRCLLWCRLKSRLLTNADHGIMVHSNLYAGPYKMLFEGTTNEHLCSSMHTILT